MLVISFFFFSNMKSALFEELRCESTAKPTLSSWPSSISRERKQKNRVFHGQGARGREGTREARREEKGSNRGETRGTSPAASNRKGKTPGECRANWFSGISRLHVVDENNNDEDDGGSQVTSREEGKIHPPKICAEDT